MVVGQTILTSAINRQESRGAHFREDFSERDDNKFLKHTMAYYSPEGIDIQYRPVTITMFEPKGSSKTIFYDASFDMNQLLEYKKCMKILAYFCNKYGLNRQF